MDMVPSLEPVDRWMMAEASVRGQVVDMTFANACAKPFNRTWEIVERCALTNRCGEFLFLKVIIKLGVDGMGGVRVI